MTDRGLAHLDTAMTLLQVLIVIFGLLIVVGLVWMQIMYVRMRRELNAVKRACASCLVIHCAMQPNDKANTQSKSHDSIGDHSIGDINRGTEQSFKRQLEDKEVAQKGYDA